ncbi:MAG: carbohydrate binding domain-containing protein, partial [Phycisphaerae bacterium]|nr:carbohydrate binding domain-containing protein [Phycisphaerae bacterium]
MKNRTVWISGIIFMLSMGLGICQAQQVENLVENGGFESGTQDPITSYGAATLEVVTELTGAAVPDSPIEGNQCLYVSVSAAGANFWDVGLKYGGYTFEQGKHYTLSAFFKSKSGDNNVNFKPELDQDPYTGYGSQQITFTEEWVEYSITTPDFTANVTPAALTFHIGYIAGDFWVDGIRFYEGDYVAPDFLGVIAASNPSPATGDTDVARDGTVLSWKPDPMAGTHNVYLGTTFTDVNDAHAANTANVISSLGQDANSLALDRLELGATYYWRVDEVNATPDKTVFKGKIWSFEVEPEYYTIPGTSITATASSTGIPYATATNTINGSGLNAQSQHSMNVDAMWLSANTDPNISIQYEFDAVYKLYGMKVWNNNQSMEPFLGVGARDVTIETSVDGTAWSVFGDVEL